MRPECLHYTGPVGVRLNRGDFGRRLSGKAQFELLENQALVRLGLCIACIAGEYQFAAIGGGQLHIEHLPGAEFLQNRTWYQFGCQIAQSAAECHVEAIRQERDEDVRFDALHILMKNGPQPGFAFQVAEDLFELSELQEKRHNCGADCPGRFDRSG